MERNKRVIMKKYWKYIICIVCLSIFMFLLLNVSQNKIINIDVLLSNFMMSIRNDKLTLVMKILTNLSSAVFLISLAILLFFILKNKKISLSIAINLALCFLINVSVKYLTVRDRPVFSLINESGYSFPSGHSTVSSAFYGFLIYLICKSKFKKSAKIVLSAFLSLIILIVIFSRLYLGVHFLTDVIASLMLSVSYLIIYITILKNKNIVG